MIFLALTAVISSASVSSGELTLSASQGVERCKHISKPAGDGCNTCSAEVCTDGEKQWETGMTICTAMACSQRFNEKPHDKKFWEESK